ncbi:MAG: DUF262 domain-containing protein [Nannocystaceae bacterium]
MIATTDSPQQKTLQEAAEKQIREHHRVVDYDTREYPVETLVDKYLNGRDTDTNELFVPEYQRDFTWERPRQSKFIESVLIGLPIPYIFVADVGKPEDDERDARLEIVDGSQRIRTLASFLTNELELLDLKKLTKLNGFRFRDLPKGRQRRFNRRTIRMIELTEKADEEVRRDMFERINTGSKDLEDMEKRRGIQAGPFLDLVAECANCPLFLKVTPMTQPQIARREPEEFVLRFFAYANKYKDFTTRVRVFLDKYVEDVNCQMKELPEKARAKELGRLKSAFRDMLAFVEKHFEHGFAKGPTNKKTPRIRFEAIAVGTSLALQEKPDLQVAQRQIQQLLASDEFKRHTTTHSSNSNPRVVGRIEYVRDGLLGGN